MRLLHTSDWHLGRSFHGHPMLPHQEAFLSWLVDTAVAREVDAVLVSGDVFDRALPPIEAVELLDRTLDAFVDAGVPLVMIPGNHDQAVRLGFGRVRSAAARIHVRCDVADLDRPVVLDDAHGPVAVYGIPYLLPDAVHESLDAERTQHAVVAAAMRRIHDHRRAEGYDRSVVLAHAFVTGGAGSDSERDLRDLRSGGIGDVAADVFDGISYAALGHLHGPQQIRMSDDATVARYAGTPMAYSFSEAGRVKSVAVVELDAAGVADVELVPTPVPRPLAEVRGTLDELLALDRPDLADAWVKAVITDRRRPDAPMEQLRARWPHTLVLAFEPEGAVVTPEDDLDRLRAAADPLLIAEHFVEYVGGSPADDDELRVLAYAVGTARELEAAG